MLSSINQAIHFWGSPAIIRSSIGRWNPWWSLKVNLLELFLGERKLEPWKSLRDLELDGAPGAVVTWSWKMTPTRPGEHTKSY